MNIQKLMEGLKSNYAPGLHPTELAERDFTRTLRNMGYTHEQLNLLYDELLSSCEYFPKVYDIHRAVSKLQLVRPERNALTQTKQMLDERESYEHDAITFEEWWHNGGYEFVRQDCDGDPVKIQKRLAVMGITRMPEAPKPKNHVSDMTFISDASADFPCDLPDTDVEVEYVDFLSDL